MTSKDRHRIKLLEFLANPSNEWPNRSTLSKEVLGFKTVQQIHVTFTAAELDEIEQEALEIRRKKYASALSRVDSGLLKRAADGDPAAAKLVYQRFEGWNEKIGMNIEQLDRLIDAELERLASGSKTGDAGKTQGEAGSGE